MFHAWWSQNSCEAMVRPCAGFLPSVKHRQQRYLHNRAQNSHQLARQRERRRGRFTSQATRNAFLRPMAPLRRTFAPDATACQPDMTARR
jgi:transposase-like protein